MELAKLGLEDCRPGQARQKKSKQNKDGLGGGGRGGSRGEGERGSGERGEGMGRVLFVSVRVCPTTSAAVVEQPEVQYVRQYTYWLMMCFFVFSLCAEVSALPTT